MTKSLGVLLAICLAGLQFLAVLLVVFSSFVTSEQALIRHARDLLRDVGINAIEHSKGFLSPAEGAAELAARLAQNRVVASDDPALLERLLFQQLQITPQFAGVYYGGEDGSFVYVMRDPAGPAPLRSKIITVDNGQRRVELIWRDKDFNIVEQHLDPADMFDPRTRPWYMRARERVTTIWTDPYIFFSSHAPGITLAAPVMDEAGESIRGAVGVDIEISMISDFLSRLNIGTHGQALILHRNGDVIAHPKPELLKARNDDGTLRFANIAEFEDPIARAAFAPLVEDGEIRVTEETPSQFTYQGQRYVSILMPVISDLLPWTIAVYAPENDFTGAIKQNRTMNIWIAAGVAVLTGILGLGLASYIHKPVRAFAVRSALISQGEMDPDEPLPKTYRELERANASLVQQIVARRATEREYLQTFEMSGRAMAQIAPETGAIIRANARFGEIVGATPEQVIGRTLADVAHPDDLATHADPTGCLVVGNAANTEMRWLLRDGRIIWVKLNSIMIRGEKGQEIHAVLTVDDITHEKDSEGQILRLNRELSHLARGNTMGQMASGLAHELNQPLTAIAQNADTALLVLGQKNDAPAALREILEEIERQSLRAGEIIRALRGFIRKDEGIRSAFDFPELLDQSLRLVQAEALEAGVTVETRLAEDLPEAEGNRVQVAQVIVNLLHNAIEAMAGAGSPERRVAVSAIAREGHLLVSVSDTGPGVDPGVALFTQFETSKPAGMGLGLSICRSIIEANGGRLWHDPEVASGACFRFTLPVHPAVVTEG